MTCNSCKGTGKITLAFSTVECLDCHKSGGPLVRISQSSSSHVWDFAYPDNDGRLRTLNYSEKLSCGASYFWVRDDGSYVIVKRTSLGVEIGTYMMKLPVEVLQFIADCVKGKP